jgi:Trk K+ transport system NAD-binding subunit
MKGHFIVCGMGRVGFRIVELLVRLGEPVTVINKILREEWQREAQEWGVRIITGDARDERLMEEAGIQTARALIVATDSDLINIEIALDAKKLHPDVPVVARIFDQTLARQMEAAFDIRRALSNSVLSAPSFAAAAMGEEVVSSFRLDNKLYAVGRVTLDGASPLTGLTAKEAGARHQVVLLACERNGDGAALPGPEDPLCAGDRLLLLSAKADWDRLVDGVEAVPQPGRWQHVWSAFSRARHRAFWGDFLHHLRRNVPLPLVTVFLVLNTLFLLSVFVFHFALHLTFVDALYFLITTITTVGYGDINVQHAPAALKLYSCLLMLLGSAALAILYSILTDFIVTARFQQLLGRQRIPHAGHFVVVGLGSVGYRLVDELRRAGVSVVAVDRDSGGEFVDAVREQMPVIIGDARLRSTLEQAGAAKAHAVLAVTSDDAVNLSVSLETKQMNRQVRTVVRLFDADFARKVQAALGVDAALGAFLIGAPTFTAAALYPNVLSGFVADARLFAVIEREAGAEWQGLTPSQLRASREVQIVALHVPGNGYTLTVEDRPLERNEKVLAVIGRKLQPAGK